MKKPTMTIDEFYKNYVIINGKKPDLIDQNMEFLNNPNGYLQKLHRRRNSNYEASIKIAKHYLENGKSIFLITDNPENYIQKFKQVTGITIELIPQYKTIGDYICGFKKVLTGYLIKSIK